MRATVFFLFAFTLSAQDPGRGVNFYSIEKERALGAQLAQEFRRTSPIVENPELLARIETIAEPLIPRDSKFEYSLALFESDQKDEPVALPGGYVFVSTGLIRAAQHSDELAGMLAHAIAHIESRHGTKQATKGQIVQQATIPLIFMGGWNGQAVPRGFQEFARKNDLAADQLAASMMQSHGYSPARLADYIERLQPGSPRAAALRDLPAVDTPNTIQELQQLLPAPPVVKAKNPPRLAR
jgi:beta-barrel assembly-enhancing protease